MHTLADTVSHMNNMKRAYEEACRQVWMCLLETNPELRALVDDWILPIEKAGPWLCAPHFDQGTKSAAELYLEERGEEVVTRMHQIAHGIYR